MSDQRFKIYLKGSGKALEQKTKNYDVCIFDDEKLLNKGENFVLKVYLSNRNRNVGLKLLIKDFKFTGKNKAFIFKMDKIFEPDQILTKNEEYKEFEYSPHLNIEWPKRLIQFKVVDDLEGKKLKKIICLNISLLKQNKNLKLKNEQIFFFQNNGRTETFYYSVNVCPEDKYRLFYNNGDEIEEEKSVILNCGEALKKEKNVPNIYEIDFSSDGSIGYCVRSSENQIIKIEQKIIDEHQLKQKELIERYNRNNQKNRENIRFLDDLKLERKRKEKRKFDPNNYEDRYNLPDQANIKYLKNIIYEKTKILPSSLNPKFIYKIINKFNQVENNGPFQFLGKEKDLNEKESKSIEIDEEEKKFRKILLTEHMKNELNKRIYNSKGLPPSEEDDPNEQKIIEKMFKIDEKDKNDIKDDEINKAKKQKINESKNEQMKEEIQKENENLLVNSLEELLKIKNENFGPKNSSEEMKFQNVIATS
ncbi:hypothetical protein ACQ4LE_006087 [Meloidogyne hapla]